MMFALCVLFWLAIGAGIVLLSLWLQYDYDLTHGKTTLEDWIKSWPRKERK